MQGSDGGWGSFDADNNRLIFNNIPFADHGALLDPSTEDLTGRGLELLGTLGEDPSHPAARRGIAFIRRTQADDGSWYGRWGVELHLRDVVGAARRWGPSARTPRRSMSGAPWPGSSRARIRTAAGARPSARTTRPSWQGAASRFPARRHGRSSPCSPSAIPRARRWSAAIRYLSETQSPDGTWEDPLWNGTGFPRVFYLKYHLYAKYFPLWALGAYRSARS